MTDLHAVRRAILSVSDKQELAPLAQALHRHGIEMLSTGGTLKAIAALGLPVTSVAEYTESAELFDGRVKTLHPRLHAGILFRRSQPSDLRDLGEIQAQPIDLVIVNLYPFEQARERDPGDEALIEEIDIGGPSLIRGAAKNHAWVTVICEPSQYGALINELDENNGATSYGFRRGCAATVFARTATYDAVIADYLAPVGEFPARLAIPLKKQADLRYGENPHQQAALYAMPGTNGPTLTRAHILSGKELSFNNYADLDACLDLMLEFAEPFACIVKHANPCGAAVGGTVAEAYTRALATDPLSAFGSIIGVNRPVDLAAAQVIHDTEFVECVVAPSFTDDALALMTKKKSRRLLSLNDPLAGAVSPRYTYQPIRGGFLVQSPDSPAKGAASRQVVTRRTPTAQELRDLDFAWRVVKQTKSNAIVLAANGAATGIGMGQTSRVDAVFLAIKRAKERSRGSVLASEAFFPMTDNIELASEAGITAIIQPGGSKADADVIAAADEAGMAMVFTGRRHFRH